MGSDGTQIKPPIEDAVARFAIPPHLIYSGATTTFWTGMRDFWCGPTLKAEVSDWIKQTCRGKHILWSDYVTAIRVSDYSKAETIFFFDETDALLFKMRWM